MSLGQCPKCGQEKLFLRGDMMTCECGAEVPNHPLLVEARQHAKPKEAPFTPAPESFVANWPTLPQLTERVRKLENQMAVLVAAQAKPSTKRAG